MNTPQQITINCDELQQLLEPLIRRIIREELSNIIQNTSNMFFLSPDMPLYDDMKEIAQRKATNDIEIYSDDEVWNE